MNKVGILLVLFLASTSMAETRQAFIYPLGKVQGKPTFVQTTELQVSPGDNIEWKSKIEDAEGKVVMTEEATIKDGRIVRQLVEQRQVDTGYELKVEGSEATFFTRSLSGKTDPTKNKISIDEHFMTGPMTEFFLQKNIEAISKGEKLKVSFGIFEFAKALDFLFFKNSSTEDIVEIRMKPNNFIIAMLADAIYIDFDKAKKRIVHFRGRTSLKDLTGGRVKPFDAEIVYK